jgi:capsular polysaccharide biosynthesis protein
LPAAGLHLLHPGRFWAWGDAGAFFSANERLLLDLSPDPDFAPPFHPASWRIHASEPRTLNGLTAVIWSKWAHISWGHWLMEIAVRLRLLAEAGWLPDGVDRYALPYSGRDHERALLEELGIPLAKVVPIHQGDQLRCERLLTFNPAMLKHGYPSWAASALRRFRHTPPEQPTPRVHLVRHASIRPVKGGEALAAALATRGFVSLAPEALSIPAQRGLFAAARFLVGAAGSAFMHLPFCPRGTQVLLLHHPAHLHACYGDLAGHAGLRYHRLATPDPLPPPDDPTPVHHLPISPDPAATLSAVERLLREN